MSNPIIQLQSAQEPERLYVVAGKYWRIMLSTCVAVCVCAIAAGAYMLVMTFINMTVTPQEAEALQSLNRTELTNVVNALSARQTFYNERVQSEERLADPSK